MSDLDDLKEELKALLNERFNHVDTQLRLHNGWLTSLWKKVNGSDPPPALTDGTSSPPGPPLDELATAAVMKTSSHDLEIFALRQDMAAVRQMNQRQNDTQGVDKRGASYLFTTRGGRKEVLSLVAAVTGLVTTIGATYAVVSGRTIVAPPETSVVVAPAAMVIVDAGPKTIDAPHGVSP